MVTVGEAKACLITNFSSGAIFQLSLPLIHDFSTSESHLEDQSRVLFDNLDLSLVLAR